MSKNNNRLGSDPLQWIGNLDSVGKNDEVKKTQQVKDSVKRATFLIRENLIEKINDYSYWQRMKKQDVVAKALEEFFEKNPINKDD